MRKGDIVKIYQDPRTKECPLGLAQLLQRKSERGKKERFQTWEVKFLSDGYISERLIERVGQ